MTNQRYCLAGIQPRQAMKNILMKLFTIYSDNGNEDDNGDEAIRMKPNPSTFDRARSHIRSARDAWRAHGI